MFDKDYTMKWFNKIKDYILRNNKYESLEKDEIIILNIIETVKKYPLETKCSIAATILLDIHDVTGDNYYINFVYDMVSDKIQENTIRSSVFKRNKLSDKELHKVLEEIGISKEQFDNL